MSPGPIIGIIALIALSAFFSASEIAYTSVNKIRLKKAAQNGNKAAKLANRIVEKYDALLYAILIGNNLVNNFATSLATVIAVSLLGQAGAGVATIIITILILLFGEILPKTLGKEKAESVVVFAAYPLRAVMWILHPVVRGIQWMIGKLSRIWRKDGETLPTVTEEEFAAILETVEDEGVLDEERTELLQSALQFDDITAQEVLTPRKNIYALAVNDDPSAVHDKVLESRYSRIPVYEETIDNIIGVLYVNAYLKEFAKEGRVEVRDLLREPQYIHKTMKLDDALALLQNERVHVAVVLDEFGGTLGILTMEDILEELVGDIWDESDVIVDSFVQIEEGVFECDGSLALHEFFDEVDMDDQDIDSEYTTVGGWATEMLDAMPDVGDTFQYKSLTVTILQTSEKRVDRVRVEIEPENAENTDE